MLKVTCVVDVFPGHAAEPTAPTHPGTAGLTDDVAVTYSVWKPGDSSIGLIAIDHPLQSNWVPKLREISEPWGLRGVFSTPVLDTRGAPYKHAVLHAVPKLPKMVGSPLAGGVSM